MQFINKSIRTQLYIMYIYDERVVYKRLVERLYKRLKSGLNHKRRRRPQQVINVIFKRLSFGKTTVDPIDNKVDDDDDNGEK